MPEISNSSYGKSKERQKKIEGVMGEMIYYLEHDDDDLPVDEEAQGNPLETPFSLELNDKHEELQKRRMQK